jgi:hypothetical protein
VKAKIRNKLHGRKRQIDRRLDKTKFPKDFGDRPMLRGGNVRYEMSGRVQGLHCGGIAGFHRLAEELGLIKTIDERLRVFKIRLPYTESDHILNMAFVPLCGGECLQDLERLRTDINYLNALGAQRIPDPTTAGDFCRRFSADTINLLQDIYDDIRIGVWQHQPAEFFKQAILEADGTIVATTGQCKEGMDIAYNGEWGYHPLVVSLANTREVMRIVNRSGNRPSHEGAAEALDAAVETCLRGGFQRVLLRGDTDFSQTQHLDRWDDTGRIGFVFGYDSMPNLQERAETLPERAWKTLQRPPQYTPVTGPRHRPANVKDERVRERGYLTLRLQSEEVAEFNYRPTACDREYRMIVVRKNISREKGEERLFDEIRYFFYITNDWVSDADEIVFSANDRCHQENLIQQLKNGIHALKAPVDTLNSNWAYMVITSLAWNLKSWSALRLPENGRWADKYRAEKQWLLGLEFKAFINAMVMIPCQIVRQARRVVFRMLSYHQYLPIFFRLTDAMGC